MADTYRTDSAVESHATVIEAGDGRHFLILRFRVREWKTLVLQHTLQPDCWVSRRELHENMDPVLALSGYLFGPSQPQHPVEQLKRQLASYEKLTWSLRKRVSELERADHVKAARKRGKRVRRNT
jgi:hypothetical protein